MMNKESKNPYVQPLARAVHQYSIMKHTAYVNNTHILVVFLLLLVKAASHSVCMMIRLPAWSCPPPCVPSQGGLSPG